jgi:hypothetical protein
MVGKHTTWELTLRKHTSNPSFINFFVSFLPSTFTLLRMLKLKRNPWARIAPHVVRGNAMAMNFGRILDNVIMRVDKSKATLSGRRCGPSPKGFLVLRSSRGIRVMVLDLNHHALENIYKCMETNHMQSMM